MIAFRHEMIAFNNTRVGDVGAALADEGRKWGYLKKWVGVAYRCSVRRKCIL